MGNGSVEIVEQELVDGLNLFFSVAGELNHRIILMRLVTCLNVEE